MYNIKTQVFKNKKLNDRLYNASLDAPLSDFEIKKLSENNVTPQIEVSKVNQQEPVAGSSTAPPIQLPPEEVQEWIDSVAAVNETPITTWREPNETNSTASIKEDDLMSNISSVSKAVAHMLTDVDGFSGSNMHKKTMYATSISSSLLSLLTHTVNLSSNTVTTTTKVMTGLSITADLISLANTLWYMAAEYCKPAKDLESVIESVPSLVKDLTDNASQSSASVTPSVFNFLFGGNRSTMSSNSINWMEYITPGIKCVVTISLMIATGFDKEKIDYAVKLGSLTDLANKTSKTADDAIGCVLTKICGIDMTGDMATYNEVMKLTQRSQELAVLPVYKFLQNPTLCSELKSIFDKAIKLPAPQKKEIAYTLRIAIAGLNRNLDCLREKLKVVNEILDVKRRQECVGLMLAGDKGTGKSSFAAYIFDKVSQILGYPSDVYNVDKEGGFYTPYNGAVFGILNEFMGVRQADGMIESYNKIVSGDPYNFESAGLESKTQPCQLKLLVSTSNCLNPNLNHIMTPGAAEALWSRTTRVKVVDEVQQELIEKGVEIGRHTLQPHRKPDFSHLTLFYTNTCKTSSETVEASLKRITVPALINYLAAQCAMRELNFMEQMIQKTPSIETECETRLKFLNETVKGRLNSNSDTDYFVVRIQGVLGCGKTTLSQTLVNSFTHVYPNMNVVNVTSFKPLESTSTNTHCIYTVDDMIRPEDPEKNYAAYVSWINTIPKHSIVVLVENKTFEKVPHYDLRGLFTNKPIKQYIYDTVNLGSISGVARRIGLNGLVRCDDGLYFNGSSQITIHGTGHYQFKVNDAHMAYSDIAEYVFRCYKLHRINTSEITLMRTEAPYVDCFDIDIEAQNIAQLMKSLSSLKDIMLAYAGTPTYCTLKIDKKFLEYMSGKSMEKTWVVKEEVKTLQDLVNLGTRIYAAVFNFKPGCTVRINLKEEETSFVAKDRIIYMQGLDTQEPFMFAWTREGLRIYSEGFLHIVKPYDYAEYHVNKNITGSMDALDMRLIPQVVKFIEDADNKSVYKIAFINAITQLRTQTAILQSKKFKAWMLYKKHPLLCIVGGFLAGATVLTSLVFFIKWLVKKNPPPLTANTSDDEEDVATGRSSNIVKNRKEFECRDTTGALRQCGYDRNWDKDNSWAAQTHRGNTSPVAKKLLALMKTNNWGPPEIVKYVISANKYEDIREVVMMWPDAYLNETLSKKACMLSRKETIWQPPSQLENFNNLLRKSYVRVITSSGTNYGLGLYGNYILTISHAFNDYNEEVKVSSNGIMYNAKVERILRERDLTIIRVTDKTFPPLPDMRSKLVDFYKIGNNPSCVFVRPVENGTFYQTSVDYLSTVKEPFYDNENANFKLQDKIWVVRFMTGADMHQFIKKGDCGFPLLALVNNEYKIIGIHNSLCSTGAAYFSAINKQDIAFADLTANSAAKQMVPYVHPEGTTHVVPKYYWDTFAIVKESCYSKTEPPSPLKVDGFIPALMVHSNPKNKKIKISIKDAKTECLTMPSAIRFIPELMDPSKHFRNSFGVINPMFTQAVKFTERTPTYRTYDKDITKHVFELIKIRVQRDYGTFQKINTVKVLNGVPGTALKNFDLSTSGGLLLKAKYGLNNKKDIIVNVGTKEQPFYQFAETPHAEEIRLLYEEHVSCILGGVPPLMFARDCPKVELLPIEKVKEGKVRLFNELDFFYNMMLKAFFGDALDKIIRNHVTSPYKIGMNPYVEATINMLKFNLYNGQQLCTDVKGLDKNFPPEIIEYFVETFCGYLEPFQRKALTESLSNTIHIIDGTAYFLSTGNESGSFLTTMLNCYCMEFLLLYYFTTLFQKQENRLPSLSEIEDDMAYAIYGDDKMVKFNKRWNVSIEDYQKIAAMFNIKVTEAKLKSDNMSFCSREYIKDDRSFLYYPALKQGSVVSSLWWFERLDAETIAQNLNIVLFEASFHSRKFFESVLHDVLEVCRQYKVKHYVDFCSYDLYRDTFRRYVLGELKTPSFLALGSHAFSFDKQSINNCENTNNPNNQNNLENLSDLNSAVNFIIDKSIYLEANTQQKMALSKLNEYLMQVKSGEKLIWDDHSIGEAHMLTWTSNVKLGELRGSGTGDTKRKARDNAAQQILDSLDRRSLSSNMMPSSSSDEDDDDDEQIDRLTQGISELTIGDNFVIASLQETYRHALPKLETIARIYLWLPQDIYSLPVTYKMIGTFRLEVREVRCGKEYFNIYSILNSAAQKLFSKSMFMKYMHRMEADVRQNTWGCYIEQDVHSNMDQSVAPAVMDQASSAQQIQSLPSNTNPQPTGVAPAMTTTGENIMGAVQPMPTDTLQPVGAPPMLGVGAIDFDLKSLVYEQFLDSDVEFTVTDEQPTGTILFQIPYDPLGTYVNPYIKQWVGLHERYTGALMFRFTVIGNPMFSGALGICWQPSKVTTATIKISESMKYAYHAEGVTMPWNRIHYLHDARRQYFYRTTDDTDIDNRPHLVVYLLMSLQNPLKPDVITRVRVSSKLANASESNSFRVANPKLDTPLTVSALGSYKGNFYESFKQCFYKKLWMYTDGNLAGQQLSNINYEYYPVNMHNPNSVAANTVLTAEASLNGYAQAWEFSKTNEAPYTWTSFPAGTEVCVRWTIFGASQYFTTYNEKFKSIQDDIEGGETAVKQVFELDIPTGVIKFDNPQNVLQAIWAYKAPSNDPPNTYSNFGGYKMVFSQGIIIVDVFQTNVNRSLQTEDGTNPTLNYGFIDNPRLFLDPSVTPIAANCSVLKMTFTQPSSVPNGIQGPTARDDESILRYFASIASRIGSDEVVQMKLADATTQRNIATIRYNALLNNFYIYGENGSYKTLPRSLEDVNIVSLEVVPIANPMDITDTATWSSRVIDSARTLMRPVYDEPSHLFRPRRITANMMNLAAAIAGGGSSPLNAIFGTANNIYSTETQKGQNREQREHELELQGNSFKQQSHENEQQREFFDKLQQNKFTHSNEYQEKEHSQQQKMQQGEFGQQTKLQEGQFGQQSKLQKNQFKQQSKTQQQQQKFEREQQQSQFQFQGRESEAERANKRFMQESDQKNQAQIAQQDVRNKAFLSGSTTALRNLPGSVFS